MRTVEEALKDLPRLPDNRLACGDHPDVAAVKVLGFLSGKLAPVCDPCLKVSREYFKESGC